MNIGIICALYPPEPLVSASMARDLALHLINQGFEVTVLCPQPSRPVSADYRRYENFIAPIVTDEDGIVVVRLPSFTAPCLLYTSPSPRDGLLSRMPSSA